MNTVLDYDTTMTIGAGRYQDVLTSSRRQRHRPNILPTGNQSQGGFGRGIMESGLDQKVPLTSGYRLSLSVSRVSAIQDCDLCAHPCQGSSKPSLTCGYAGTDYGYLSSELPQLTTVVRGGATGALRERA